MQLFMFHSKESAKQSFPCCERDCWEPKGGEGEGDGCQFTEL